MRFAAVLCLFAVPLSAGELHDAAARGDAARVERLFTCLFCSKPDVDAFDSSGWTALMRAAAGGHTNALRILLRHKASVNARTSRGRDSALAFALLRGQNECAHLLLAAGADPEPAGLLGPPLVLAVRHADAAVVKAMLTRGANASRRPSPLFDAVELGRPEVIALLIEAGADPDVRSPASWTPLFAAVKAGRMDAARELLRLGADPNAAVPPRAVHSLAIAAESGRADLVGLLVSAGASPDLRYYYLREEDGGLKAFRECTPLMAAARSGSMETVRALLDAKADVLLRDDQGHDALWHAQDSRNRAAETLLRQRIQSLRKR